MKRELKPSWTDEEKRAGERRRRAWDAFFTEGAGKPKRGGDAPLGDSAAIVAVQERHQDRLLQYPNVVGVAAGIRTRGGKPTGDPCLVVLVTRKIPKTRLPRASILPRRLDGVPVDVVEVGDVRPLPA